MFNFLKKIILVSRPIFWPIAPAAYLFGIYLGSVEMSWIVLLQAILLWIPLSVYVFGINDINDLESDKTNPRRRGLLWGAKIIESDRGWIEKLSIAAVLLIFLSALASMNILHIIVTALFLPFPYLYSAKPIRLKSRPVLDSLTNATYTYAPFAMGYSLSGSLGFLDPAMIIFALVFSSAHAIGTIMDLPGDKRAGIKTFASVLGKRPAAAFSVLLIGMNIPFALEIGAGMFGVIGAYFLASIYVLWKPTPDNAKKCFVVMVGSLMIWLAYSTYSILFGPGLAIGA